MMSSLLCCLRQKPDYKYLNELESFSNLEVYDNIVHDRIKKIFDKNSDNLVADLLENPEHITNYRKIGAKLREKDVLNSFQSSIGYVQKIARLLKNHDAIGLNKISKQMEKLSSSDPLLSSILARFHRLDLRTHLDEIRAISHPIIRAHVMAALINRGRHSLFSLGLTKKEILQVGPHLTFLNWQQGFDDFWSRGEIYTFLETCTNLKSLIIASDLITRLPELPSCEELNCSNCSNLSNLPENLNCSYFECENCENLRELPNLPFCEELHCSGAGNLTHLPALPNCKILDCTTVVSLTELPPLPLCTKLNCQYTNLRELPPLPLCKLLNCRSCTELMHLPDLPSCERLECSHCNGLTELTALPNCKTLICERCTNLRGLPVLTVCKNLNCIDCVNLTHLPALSFCEYLYCSGCTSLTDVSELPSIHTVNYENCSSLNIESRERLNHLGQDVATLKIHVKDLNEDPLGVLLKLEIPLIQQRIKPQIRFIELDGRMAAGLDAGGVFRIFISRLMQSLIAHSDEPKQLKFKKTNSGLYIPFLDKKRDLSVQIKGFQVLGAIFELCYHSLENQSVMTGICFDRKVFEVITSLSKAKLLSVNLSGKSREIPSEIRLKMLEIFLEGNLKKQLKLVQIPLQNLKPEEFEILKKFALSNIEEKVPENLNKSNLNLKELEELKPLFQAIVKNYFLNEELDHVADEWLPSVIMAKQMEELIRSCNLWENLRSLGARELEIRVQGVVDKKTLIHQIVWKKENRALDPHKINKTKEFVEKWINEATFKDLERFNNFVGGAPSINPSEKIIFQLYDTPNNRFPSTHSCFFEIDLTVNYENYEKFKKMLEIALDYVNSQDTSSLENI